MNFVNPKYVLRNYMAQLAIDAANKEDYSVIKELNELLKKPYQEQPNSEKWYAKRPDWAREKIGCSMLSCSS
jgi:serine/tyrosine/threonine adenylyltransferase